MNSQTTSNIYFKSTIFKSTFIGIILFCSCSNKQSYKEIVKDELEKGVRYDSIIYGVRLGMTYRDFYSYCWGQNKKSIFKPNTSGTRVSTILNKGFNSPVVLEFYPRANQNNEIITKYYATLKYENFSYYNKKNNIKNLLNETIKAFEKGYYGNDFFTVPHENKLLKYNYIKIDGNRKIMVKPTFEGNQLIIEFEDLLYN